MNMKLPPDQLKTRKGRDNMLNLVRTLFNNDGYHIQFNVLDTEMLQGRAEAPGKLPRPGGPGGRFQRVLHQTARGRAERGYRTDLAALRVSSEIQRNRYGVALRHAVAEVS